MSIDRIHQQLGWPKPEELWQPSGAAPRVYAALADRKIGDALRRVEVRAGIRVGVLSPDSADDSSQLPIAIVCEFQAPATSVVLAEAHRLAWCFSRAPLLITVEPHLVRTWSCCEAPSPDPSRDEISAEIVEARFDPGGDLSLPTQAARSLHWLELITGRFFHRHEARFQRNGCADRLLLENLKQVRRKLLQQDLSDDTSHDLLARLIFIQFLFDRKDSSGAAALNAAKLAALNRDGVLAAAHDSLFSILDNYNDSYALFRWLDSIFNGDLFPGKGGSENERESDWSREMAEVQPKHLSTLADFVSGRTAMKSKQRLLWKQYSFDAIPLEFISSIYEEFVAKGKKRKSGTVYTPPHVVDFMLDEVLPWDNSDWNVRVLDPACGSGVFLVKAFQRMAHRWRLANPGKHPKPADLRTMLEKNLFGVDSDPHAVRVASFSLYLAMCDEIDPKHYWTHVRFPRMRGTTLVCSDFFAEDVEGFRAKDDAGTFDIVVGNAPWGQDTVGASDISRWQRAGWPAAYNSIGPIFLAKSVELLRARGRLSMMQPAGLILNDVGTSQAFRKKLFAAVAVEAIVNLAPLRFTLFPSAIGPACIVTFRNEPPSDQEFVYLCPKPVARIETEYRIVVEPYDVHLVHRRHATEDARSWTALMWGGPRDVALVKRLGEGLTLMNAAPGLKKREGIIRGRNQREQKELLGKPVLEQPDFPMGTWLHLDARALRKNEDASIHFKDSTDFAAFEIPQLLIKQSWKAQTGRFEAALVDSDQSTGGVLCTQSYITVHVPSGEEHALEAACLSCNSILAVYFLLMSSPRMASYRPEPAVRDWMEMPIPPPAEGLLNDMRNHFDVDHRVFERLGLTATERALVEDAVNITLADFKGDSTSPGRQPTRSTNRAEHVLTTYCKQFVAVVKAAFGSDKRVRATIFQEPVGDELPVRLVALHLNWPADEGIVVESADSSLLHKRLREVSEALATESSTNAYRRMARVYDHVMYNRESVPTIYLVKPDSVRYWTRAAALRDADEVCADFLLYSDASSRRAGMEGAFA